MIFILALCFGKLTNTIDDLVNRVLSVNVSMDVKVLIPEHSKASINLDTWPPFVSMTEKGPSKICMLNSKCKNGTHYKETSVAVEAEWDKSKLIIKSSPNEVTVLSMQMLNASKIHQQQMVSALGLDIIVDEVSLYRVFLGLNVLEINLNQDVKLNGEILYYSTQETWQSIHPNVSVDVSGHKSVRLMFMNKPIILELSPYRFGAVVVLSGPNPIAITNNYLGVGESIGIAVGVVVGLVFLSISAKFIVYYLKKTKK